MNKKINSFIAAFVVAAVLIAAYFGVIFAVQKNSKDPFGTDVGEVTTVDESTNGQSGTSDNLPFDGSYTVNSREVFYPCQDLYFLLSAEEITVNEPCKEKDFDPLKYYDTLKKNTNNACKATVVQKGNPTKVKFEFGSDVSHECIVTLNFD